MDLPMIMPADCEAREDRDWASYLDAFAALDPSLTYGSRVWAGTASLGETISIGRRGWPEGAAYVRNITLPAVTAATTRRVQSDAWAWDVTGADYDVGEYLSGTPECWLTPASETVKPRISILVNIAVSAAIPAETIKMRGASVAALALHLQASGYIVEVWSMWAVSNCGKQHFSRVRLSDPDGGPLDTDRLMFGLAHPAAARQLGHFMAGHGMPIDGPPWTADLYLPCMVLGATDWTSLEAVTRWIESTYNKITGK